MSAKAEANRRNAQKSTGPKTAAGKRRTAQNAVRHGLSSARPDPDRDRQTLELAEKIRADDPERSVTVAFELAHLFIQLDRIAAAKAGELRLCEARLMEQGLQHAPLSLVQDLAQLSALPRLLALGGRERRVHQRLRKLLKA